MTLQKQRYGAPRLTDELRAQGRVYNIKNRGGPVSAGTAGEAFARRFSPVSYREHGLPVSENLLGFYASVRPEMVG